MRVTAFDEGTITGFFIGHMAKIAYLTFKFNLYE